MMPSYGSDTTSQEIAGGMREFLAENCDVARLRQVWAGGRFDRELWGQLAELGFCGALASEGAGGLGLRPEEVVLALEEFGYSGASLPVADTVAVIVPILERFGNDAQKEEFLPGLISGELVGTSTVAVGGERALYAANSDLVLFERAGSLYLLRADQFTAEALHAPDSTAGLAQVHVHEGALIPANRLGEGSSAAAWRSATWAAAAVLNGVSRRMLDLTVEYSKTREQFGRAIGSFQAIKHMLADAWVSIESSRPASWYAAFADAAEIPDAVASASVAKASASDAAQLVGDMALQIHGGIGFTWEHPLHFWMKKGKLLEAIYGSRETHLRRLGEAIGAEWDDSDALFAGA